MAGTSAMIVSPSLPASIPPAQMPSSSDFGALDAADHGSSLLSQQMRDLLLGEGIAQHQQARWIAERLQCSYPAARRKILGKSPFSEDEIQSILAAFNLRWGGLHGLSREDGTPGPAGTSESSVTSASEIPATWRVDGVEIPCFVTMHVPAREAPPASRGPVLIQVDGRQVVVMSEPFRDLPSPAHAIRTIRVAPAYPGTGPRLAVLDDDAVACKSTTLAMQSCGFAAQGFVNEALLREAIEQQPFDAYILDWQLRAGHSAAEIMTQIHSRHPSAALLVLSGHLTGNPGVEDEVTALVRRLGASMLPKPCPAYSIVAALRERLRSKTAHA